MEPDDVLREPPHAVGALDATTILDNVVRLDQMLDEGSRRQLGAVPYLELSKYLKIRRPAQSDG